MNLSKNQLKLIVSLRQKKYRQKHKLFIAEGIKVVSELMKSSLEVEQLFVTENSVYSATKDKTTIITPATLKKISSLKTPNSVLGLFKIPEEQPPQNKGLIVALDDINDPGNLGTIIRLCDWFGVKQLLCSKNTVDCYNAKVVQASMGSITRVQINYIDLESYIPNHKKAVYIAEMKGENIYKTNLPKDAILIMGNEANGVSDTIKKMINNRLSIPRFGDLQQTESLNVATATAILLSEFRRGN